MDYCLEPEANSWGIRPPIGSLKDWLTLLCVIVAWVWVDVREVERVCVRVIGALERVCATRQPVSILMKRWLRPEPTQLLQGIVGRREAITEISSLHECFDPKWNVASPPIFRLLRESKTRILIFAPTSRRAKKYSTFYRKGEKKMITEIRHSERTKRNVYSFNKIVNWKKMCTDLVSGKSCMSLNKKHETEK